MIVQCIIVDDEPLARERIRELLRPRVDFKVIAECCNGFEAVQAITTHAPDLVFLDIQMPDLDGFDIIKEIGSDRMPPVVFVTAFHHFATHAFDAQAVDYLLKPFDRRRFEQALERVLEHLEKRRIEDLDEKVRKLVELVEAKERYPDRLALRSSGTVHFIKVASIDWIEASRNYVKIHVDSETHLLRETLSNLEARLDPQQFLRIHRSTIVNIDRIRKLESSGGAEAQAELEDGTRLMVSRAYRLGRVKDLLSL